MGAVGEHEASFPYTWAGASCSDVIDGAVTTHCSSDNAQGDATKGCSDLVDVSMTGVYNIVYTAQNTVGLWNNGANCRGGASTYGRKVTVSDTLRPVITLRYKGTKVAQGTRDTTGNDITDSPHHGGRRPCPVGLQHAPHRGRHQRAGLSSIYTTYAHVSLRGIGLPSCVIFAWTSCMLLTANCQCSDKTKSVC